MRILIVGAGIAGLAAAKAFELQGFKPELVDRRAPSSRQGQSIFLLGNATRALRDLGLEEKLLEFSYPIRKQTILSASGKVLNEVDTDEVWGGSGPCIAVPRKILLEILRSSLQRTTIAYDASVLRTVPRQESREVHFLDGRISNYDLVVGADGIRSSLRLTHFPNGASRALDLAAWRLIVDNDTAIDRWTAMLGRQRTLLAVPLPGSKLYVYADCTTTAFGDGSIRTLKKVFEEFGDPVGSLVSDLPDETFAHRTVLEEVHADRYIADRLILIGDAAHASSPSMAQGAAMAIEDAAVLARCISIPGEVPRSLDQFYERRKSRVEWVQKQSAARDRLRTAPAPLRNMILRYFGTKLYHRSYDPLVIAL